MRQLGGVRGGKATPLPLTLLPKGVLPSGVKGRGGDEGRRVRGRGLDSW